MAVHRRGNVAFEGNAFHHAGEHPIRESGGIIARVSTAYALWRRLLFRLPRKDPALANRRCVDIFFYLSGFMITSTLLASVPGRDNIDYQKFYLGTALRLLPVYCW
jgi:peptidoglycan/LPS O-acetylase OafA/YrhL